MQASVVGACPKPGESGRVAAGRASGIKMGDEGDAPLISPCGVAPSLMVCVSASGYLPLHQKKVQKDLFWHQLTWVVPEKGHKMCVCVLLSGK